MGNITEAKVFNHIIEDPRRPIVMKEAVFFVSLSLSTIYKKVSKGEIPSYRQGRQLYFLREELRAWLLANPVHKQSSLFEK